MPRRLTQNELDRWLPTVVQYAGIGVMIYAVVTRDFLWTTPALGMILFKRVYGDGSKD